MTLLPPRSTLFPTRRSSDLLRCRGPESVFARNSPPPSRRPRGLLRRFAGCSVAGGDRKSTRLNSSHVKISYAVFCLKKKKQCVTQHLNINGFHSSAQKFGHL